MKIKKDDQVLVISGKDRGKKGKVLKAFPEEQKLLVEGVNLRKKHIKPRRTEEKGQIIELPAPIPVSNVKLICSKCGKATRIGYKVISKIPPQRGAAHKVGEPRLSGREVLASSSPRRSGRSMKSSGKNKKSKIRICKKCGKEI
ncbi:50S ribosomal protein L24 [Patescibacteria group bacterium]|nr:50S ribosomal protein L24 [Patescibacteria group bacterium]